MELEDHMIAPSSYAIEYTDNELTRSLYRPRHYNFSSKSVFSINFHALYFLYII